jgi:outer membrane receptor protein involved in Fe transport
MATRSRSDALRSRIHRTLWGRAPVAFALGLAFSYSGSTPAAEEKEADSATELEEVSVTGSRITVVTGMDTPTPVATLEAEEIQAMAPTSLTAALVQLPQIYNSSTAESFQGVGYFQSPGGGSLNLRGIGSKRTLTLLDGRRMVPSTAYGGSDINLFPVQMIKRIEVVTGGASAAYGTDAVAGVVNFILDTRFDGFRLSGQQGFSDLGDARNQQYSMALGHQFGDSTHLMFSAGFMTQDKVIGWEGRDSYQGCGLIANPVAAPSGHVLGESPDLPLSVPSCNLHSTAATYGGMFTIAGTKYELQPEGQAIPFVTTAAGAVQPGGGGQNQNITDAQVAPSQNRKNVFAYLDHDVSDNLNVYFQGIGGWQTLTSYGRSGDILAGPPQQLTIYRNNAYLPSSVAAIMDAASVSSFTMTKYGLGDSRTGGSATWANISRTRSATLGFKSTITADGFFNGWNLDGFAQYGKNNLDAKQADALRLDRVYLATDAVADPVTGSVRCNITVTSGYVPGCVPLNVFGVGNASPAAIDWITGYDPGQSVTVNPFIGYDTNGVAQYGDPYTYVSDAAKHRIIKTTQKVFELNASGKLFEGFGAGPVTGAVGLHWREEGIDQKVKASTEGNNAADPTIHPVWCSDGNNAASCLDPRVGRPAGNIGIRGVGANSWQNIVDMQFSNVPFIAGSFTVKELFAESLVPVIANAPWMKEFNFSGAIRWADYGGSGTIWSWKGGLNATFTDEWRLRGTYSRDTRAANIAERFDRTGGFTLGLTDPTNPDPSTGWVQGQSVATTVNGGNPNVDPETANTFTVGVVYRPEWLDGFSASVDWLKVSLKGAIENLPAQDVLNLCAAGDQDQCARITRDATTNLILFVPQTAQNLNKVTQESVDLELSYYRPIQIFGGNERLGLRLFSTVLLENSITSSNGTTTDYIGNVTGGSPATQQLFKRKANLSVDYTNGPFNWNVQARYIGKGKLSSLYNLFSTSLDRINYQVADNTVASVIYFDTRLGYSFDLGDNGGQMELFANVNNLLDRDAPTVLGLNNALQTGGGYSYLGRTFVLGMSLKY